MCVSHRGMFHGSNSPFFSRRFPPCLTGSLAVPLIQPSLCHFASLSNIHVHARHTRASLRAYIRVCAAEALSSSLLLSVLSAPVHPREDQYEPVVVVPILSALVGHPPKRFRKSEERVGRFISNSNFRSGFVVREAIEGPKN